jgi:hypothetical protein
MVLADGDDSVGAKSSKRSHVAQGDATPNGKVDSFAKKERVVAISSEGPQDLKWFASAL